MCGKKEKKENEKRTGGRDFRMLYCKSDPSSTILIEWRLLPICKQRKFCKREILEGSSAQWLLFNSNFFKWGPRAKTDSGMRVNLLLRNNISERSANLSKLGRVCSEFSERFSCMIFGFIVSSAYLLLILWYLKIVAFIKNNKIEKQKLLIKE